MKQKQTGHSIKCDKIVQFKGNIRMKQNKIVQFILFVIIYNCPVLSIEHPNIAFQKKFEAEWQQLTKSAEISPTKAANKLKKALQSNTTTNNSDHKPFLLGLSSSAYQFEGGIGEESSFHRFASNKSLALPGDACNFWKNYPQMIKQMKEECNINSYRMSISWERIQKTKDSWDCDAIEHYKKIIQELKAYQIEPLVVLHHYTIPTWFEDLGGFEKEENIHYFVDFAVTMYEALAEDVTYWSTFNAIEGYAFKGYFTLDGAPGKEKSMQKTAEVMLNMLKAHVQIYKRIKGDNGAWQQLKEQEPASVFPEPLIGIQKNVIFLDIAYDTLLQRLKAPITGLLCRMGDKLQNDGFYGFFTKGIYSIYVPFYVSVSYQDKDAPVSIDWIGVNTYANQKREMMQVIKDKELLMTTQNENYRFYPQGLYRAVKEVEERLNEKRNRCIKPLRRLPLWITENGIAAHTDEQRTSFFQQTLFGVTKLVEEGYNIMGYTPWASYDNYEWGAPLGQKQYGMFSYNFETKETGLKEGSQYFAEFTKEFNKIDSKPQAGLLQSIMNFLPSWEKPSEELFKLP